MVQPTTKLNIRMVSRCIFRRVPILRQHHYGRICVWRLVGERTWPSFIRYRHTGLAHALVVWVATGYTTKTPLVRVVGNLNIQRYVSQILRPVTMLYFQGIGNIIFQEDNTRPHVARPILTYLDAEGVRLFQASTSFRSVTHLKSSDHGLLRNWAATALQLLRLIKCGMYLKQHGMTCAYLSCKTNSTRCLIVFKSF